MTSVALYKVIADIKLEPVDSVLMESVTVLVRRFMFFLLNLSLVVLFMERFLICMQNKANTKRVAIEISEINTKEVHRKIYLFS